jgi:hypothetical protein
MLRVDGLQRVGFANPKMNILRVASGHDAGQSGAPCTAANDAIRAVGLCAARRHRLILTQFCRL